MRQLFRILFALCTILVPQSAFACADDFMSWKNPIQSRKDCSFRGFGVDGNYSGNPVIDLGGGKIGQLLVEKQTCPYQEKLLFVDCTNGESATVDGILDPVVQRDLGATGAIMLGGNYLIKYIQKPTGALALSAQSTVADVVNVAKRSGYDYSTDVIGDFEKRNRKWIEYAKEYWDLSMNGMAVRSQNNELNVPFDQFCGCKRFYEGSVGAKK